MHIMRNGLVAMLAAHRCLPPPSRRWRTGRAAGQRRNLRSHRGRVLPMYCSRAAATSSASPATNTRSACATTSGERALAVMSVDGVNVITGDTASPAQSGYVLGPY